MELRAPTPSTVTFDEEAVTDVPWIREAYPHLHGVFKLTYEAVITATQKLIEDGVLATSDSSSQTTTHVPGFSGGAFFGVGANGTHITTVAHPDWYTEADHLHVSVDEECAPSAMVDVVTQVVSRTLHEERALAEHGVTTFSGSAGIEREFHVCAMVDRELVPVDISALFVVLHELGVTNLPVVYESSTYFIEVVFPHNNGDREQSYAHVLFEEQQRLLRVMGELGLVLLPVGENPFGANAQGYENVDNRHILEVLRRAIGNSNATEAEVASLIHNDWHLGGEHFTVQVQSPDGRIGDKAIIEVSRYAKAPVIALLTAFFQNGNLDPEVMESGELTRRHTHKNALNSASQSDVLPITHPLIQEQILNGEAKTVERAIQNSHQIVKVKTRVGAIEFTFGEVGICNRVSEAMADLLALYTTAIFRAILSGEIDAELDQLNGYQQGFLGKSKGQKIGQYYTEPELAAYWKQFQQLLVEVDRNGYNAHVCWMGDPLDVPIQATAILYHFIEWVSQFAKRNGLVLSEREQESLHLLSQCIVFNNEGVPSSFNEYMVTGKGSPALVAQKRVATLVTSGMPMADAVGVVQQELATAFKAHHMN